MIGLVDCNNFFVSCERAIHPELVSKPVVVLSNNDGCAVALSNEAKALGIKRGDPFFKIRDICQNHGVVVLSGTHSLYNEISARVMMILRALSNDKLEIYSVDEAFMEIDERLGELAEYGRYVVDTVMRHSGIPVSLGIAPTKTIAKVAARFAKKYPGYKGACIIDTDEKLRKALSLTPISDVWGIGRRHSRKLIERGVRTALDFATLPHDTVRRMMSITGERTWRELNGQPCITHEPVPPERRTISSSRSFARDITEPASLRQAICAFTSILGKKLRADGLLATDISVFICTNRFHKNSPQYYNTATLRLPEATDFTPALAETALRAFESIYRPGLGYKRAGVTLSRLCTPQGVQPNLFSDTKANEKKRRLMKVVDDINAGHPSANPRLRMASMGDGFAPLTRREHDSHTELD